MKVVRIEPTFDSWREKARQLIFAKIHYEYIEWMSDSSGFIFSEEWDVTTDIKKEFVVPQAFMKTSRIVSAYRDPSTWTLLYRILYRLIFENKNLLNDPLDPDILELERRSKLVTRDIHKMKAFVRFKEVESGDKSVFMAWHNPDHRIIRLAAPFFQERFNGMNWVIMTSDETVHWDGLKLTFLPGVSREEAPQNDDKEELWKVYYKSIFNPARIKISAMKKEMPVRHWKTLPETELITGLVQDAPNRLKEFYDSQKAVNVYSQKNFHTLDGLNEELFKCKACGICPQSNGPVPGIGQSESKIMIVGEQPGDEEDKNKIPFIGPAGNVLNQALNYAGYERKNLYLTNAVKGFKFLPKQHQRWHKGATLLEIKTCSIWLKQEMTIIKPELVVCLGRSAAYSVLGKLVKVSEVENKIFSGIHKNKIIVLPHPASILRSQEKQKENLEKFIESWRRISKLR